MKKELVTLGLIGIISGMLYLKIKEAKLRKIRNTINHEQIVVSNDVLNKLFQEVQVISEQERERQRKNREVINDYINFIVNYEKPNVEGYMEYMTTDFEIDINNFNGVNKNLKEE